jgi:hypothetical protein
MFKIGDKVISKGWFSNYFPKNSIHTVISIYNGYIGFVLPDYNEPVCPGVDYSTEMIRNGTFANWPQAGFRLYVPKIHLSRIPLIEIKEKNV